MKQVYAGDCLAVLKTLPANSIDACVTDPPYHLTTGKKGGSGPRSLNENSPAGRARIATGFMGKSWDGGDIAFRREVWREVMRVLKPGGHLLSFGGTRTYHRMACAIEDAGFEIRDTIMWVYGSGFPKSHDVSKGIDRAAGAKRKVVGNKPSRMPQAQAQGWGNPGVDRFRDSRRGTVEMNLTAPATTGARQWEGWGTALKPACEPIVVARKPLSEATVAANVLKWGTGAINVDGCRVSIDDVADLSREQRQQSNRVTWEGGKASGFKDDHIQPLYSQKGRWPANVIHDGSEEVLAGFPESASGHWSGETPSLAGKQRLVGEERYEAAGSASRFFYCAKANKKERNGSKHPTVKPIALLRYLVRLVTPPGGSVLDPFAGTGTTGEAAMREGAKAILIEREAEYRGDIKRRLKRAVIRHGLFPIQTEHQRKGRAGRPRHFAPRGGSIRGHRYSRANMG